MIDPWVHEIARQRHQDLLAAAERDRLGRIARDRPRRRTVSCRLNPNWIRRRRPARQILVEVEGIDFRSQVRV